MFAATSNPAKTYAKVSIETGVEAANSHQLILMLFDGALLAISSATQHMQEKQIAEKGQAVSKAIDIIESGLKASLDVQAGGELAVRLGALYDYMCVRLAQANLKNDLAVFNEVAHLLSELKSAWVEISSDPAAVSPTKAAA